MKEVHADIWSYLGKANAICVPTNGSRNKEGRAVMGNGLALQAVQRFYGIDAKLGNFIRCGQGIYALYNYNDTILLSFPVKHVWNEDASESLIVSSAEKLYQLTDYCGWDKVILPKVGCGCGRLLWPRVRNLLKRVMGDDPRFYIVDVN